MHLTPFGVLMGVEEVRRQGVEVQELPSAETLDATSLARLAIDQVVMPEDWLGLVDDWMALGGVVCLSMPSASTGNTGGSWMTVDPHAVLG